MRSTLSLIILIGMGCIYSALPPKQPSPPAIVDAATLANRAHEVVAHFEALHCKRFLWNPPSSEENGMRRLIAETGGYDIDALANVKCEKGYVTALMRDCWSTIRCEADGIRWIR